MSVCSTVDKTVNLENVWRTMEFMVSRYVTLLYASIWIMQEGIRRKTLSRRTGTYESILVEQRFNGASLGIVKDVLRGQSVKVNSYYDRYTRKKRSWLPIRKKEDSTDISILCLVGGEEQSIMIKWCVLISKTLMLRHYRTIRESLSRWRHSSPYFSASSDVEIDSVADLSARKDNCMVVRNWSSPDGWMILPEELKTLMA